MISKNSIPKFVAIALVFAANGPAGAEGFAGKAVALDGDSIGFEIRLDLIDAIEHWQTCRQDGEPVKCGELARRHLQRLIGKGPVSCTFTGKRTYDRPIGSPCLTAEGTDLAEAMVRDGWAFAYWPFRDRALNRLPCPDDSARDCHLTSARMLEIEDEARAAGRGMWGFDRPPGYPWCARHPKGCDRGVRR